MVTKQMLLASLLLLWPAQPAVAQETAADSRAVAVAEILRAIQLPDVAEILRERGVPAEEIQEMIAAARQRGIPASESTDVLEETAETVEETGPIENFGAFVQERLQAGLRGRDLAAAIRAEHQSRGIGQGRMLEAAGRRGPPGQRGRPAERDTTPDRDTIPGGGEG